MSDIFINLGNISANFNQKFLLYQLKEIKRVLLLPKRLSGLSKNGLHADPILRKRVTDKIYNGVYILSIKFKLFFERYDTYKTYATRAWQAFLHFLPARG